MDQIVLPLLIVYAAVGLAISLFTHVSALLGVAPSGNFLFFALHAGIFPLWFPMAFIVNKMTGGMSRWGRSPSLLSWNTMLSGAPDGLRFLTYGFFIYAIANFAYFVLSTIGAPHSQHAGDIPGPEVWRGFSGHWMLFYCAGLAIAPSAYRRGWNKLTPRCPNGHGVSMSDRYCPTCGAKILPPGG